jgi:hypothetical protein
MFGRLQLRAGLTAGLLAVAACGSQPADDPPAARPATRAWLVGVTATSGGDAWAVGSFKQTMTSR